ncbi:Methyltransferase type 11 [Trichodesmium erythraeum IMS101]|uniref:Methyltransferase type 11 n=1 Tax=Trichodesmium erythraeum (strain IMS101) TaxID=203124 RepID=Q116A1_TRIEI|nr:methyltransferase [Trichodesmium erythraeum GBRTRLIN201]
MNPEKIDFNNKLIIDQFIQDQTKKSDKINVIIHPQDEMYLYALKNTDGRKDEALLRYFSNGKRILDAVKQIVEWYFDGFENISSFLDFASGYGRFSRFLVQEIPNNKIWVSDIYPKAVEFQKQQFGVEGIVSTNYPENYQINQKFDCIFACSFFSHTPQKTFTSWLEKLYSSLTENGILIFSTHDLSLMTIEADVEAEEIYFTPESESLFLKTEDYGVTYVGEKWVAKVIQKVTQGKAKWHRIQRGLCGHHDLYIIRKKEARRSNKEQVGEQIDELLNFHCHPDGGCKKIQMTVTGDIYLEGWAADINPEEKVEKISFLINGNEVESCYPKPENKTQKYQWSSTINTQNLSANDIILVKIINNFNLERVVNIYPVHNIALIPPNDLLLRISGNPSIKAFISSFDDLRYTVKSYLQTAGFNFNQFEKILDFGCGVGRYLMAFEPELSPNQKLFGCDVFAECAEWCQENIKFATVKNNDIQPPLPFENNQFDLINAISVFTHLSLDLQHLWAWDIYRVLRPGGILFMTLHGPQFFPIVYDVFRSGNSHIAEMYSIGEEGLFLYLDHQGETDGQGQHTIAAVHTPTAYQEIFSMFKHIKRFPQSNLANGQDLYILQKPISGSLVAQPINIKSEVRSQKSDINNFSKKKDAENITKKITGDINLELLNNNLEINNFLKTENVGNATEEIVGKEIEVEKILISDNGEGENLSEKILSDSQTKEQLTTQVGNIPLSNDVKTGNLSEKVFCESHQYHTEMKFQIEGQKVFRAYPQIEPLGTYSIGCKIEIVNNKNGEILVQKTLPLNNKNIFGKTNYGLIEIEIPEYSGEVIVRLKTVITDRITLPPEQEVLVSWNFANFA